MVDLLKQLESAATDEDRQSAIFAHVINGLTDEVQESATTLAVPHWFDESVVGQLNQAGVRVAANHVADLIGLGLLVPQTGATYSFPATIRELLLRRLLVKGFALFRQLSAGYAYIFLDMKAETLAAEIEGIYHALGANPKSGGRLMLERGLVLKSEPLFQWDALDRLIENFDEQDSRDVLDDDCRAYGALLKLFVPRLRQPPQDEIVTLSRLLQHPPENDTLIAEAQLRLGYAELATGNIERARATLTLAFSLCEKADRPLGAIEALRGLARIALRQDDYAQASHHFESGRADAERLGLIASGAHSIKGMAEIDFLLGRYLSAEDGFQHAIAQFRKTGARLGEANTRVSFSQLLALQHRFGDAEKHIEAAESAYLPLRQHLGLGNCFKAEAIVSYEDGKPAQALDHLKDADEQYDGAGNQTGLGYSNLVRAKALLALDRPEEAAVHLEESAKVLTKLGDRYGLAMVDRERGLLAERRQDLHSAIELQSKAFVAFNDLPNPIESSVTILAVGRVAAQLGFPDPWNHETLVEAARSGLRIFEENRLLHRRDETLQMLLALESTAINSLRGAEEAGA